MSLAITVPASVPSLFHSSSLWVPSLAEKNRVPSTLVSESGAKVSTLGLMSLTITVPASVPSPFHSSKPCVPSVATKNRVPPSREPSGDGATAASGVDVLDQRRP